MKNDGSQSTIQDKIRALAEKIPGLSGYLDEEGVRDKDKALRDVLSAEIERVIRRIAHLQGKIVEKGGLQEIGLMERSVQRLERLRDAIRHASYGFKGSTDALYTFDLSIVEAVHELTDLVSGPLTLSRDGALSKVFLEELSRTVERLEVRWEERSGAMGR